jgi:Flp pilus assembly pilin Flp
MNRTKLSNRPFSRKNQFGQGMTEYIIIVALVAIGAIAVYSTFGHTVQGQMGEITNGLAGSQSGVTSNAAVVTKESGDATTAASKAVGLDDYGSQIKDQ